MSTDKDSNTPLTKLPGYPIEPPPFRLPEVGEKGVCYQSDDIVISLYPAGTAEYYCISPMESVIFPLGPVQKWAEAFDSDKLVTQTSIPGNLGYCLKGTRVYSVNLDKKPRSHHLAISFLPSLRQAIEEEVGSASASLRTASNLISNLSTNLLVQQAQAFLANGFIGGKLVAESLANLAIIQGLQALTQTEPTVKLSKLSKESLTHILEFIEENLHRDIGLKDLAEVAGISVYHFARSFKNTHGYTPGGYITERRVARAKELLSKNKIPVSQVAVACGFSSQSYFTGVFKQHAGVTPLKYRCYHLSGK